MSPARAGEVVVGGLETGNGAGFCTGLILAYVCKAEAPFRCPYVHLTRSLATINFLEKTYFPRNIAYTCSKDDIVAGSIVTIAIPNRKNIAANSHVCEHRE